MKKLVHSYQISTYTKIIISHCKPLANLVTKHSLSVADQVKSASTELKQVNHINLLSDKQLNDVLSGPYQDFFQIFISAYGMINRINRAHVLLNEDTLKKTVDDNEEAQLKQFAEISLVEVGKLTKKLDELVVVTNQALCELVANAVQQLTEKMQQATIKFIENDFIEFRDEYPPSELQDRLVGLNIDIPKLKGGKLDFANYFYLKLYVAIYSSLGTEHKPNDFKSIEEILKKFKPTLGECADAMNQWHNELRAEVDAIIKPIAFAAKKDSA